MPLPSPRGHTPVEESLRAKRLAGFYAIVIYDGDRFGKLIKFYSNLKFLFTCEYQNTRFSFKNKFHIT